MASIIKIAIIMTGVIVAIPLLTIVTFVGKYFLWKLSTKQGRCPKCNNKEFEISDYHDGDLSFTCTKCRYSFWI